MHDVSLAVVIQFVILITNLLLLVLIEQRSQHYTIVLFGATGPGHEDGLRHLRRSVVEAKTRHNQQASTVLTAL